MARGRGLLIMYQLIYLTDLAQAPGEAEAELAYLNRKGHIDAILTDDSDAFIFGAQTIIKK